MFGKDQDLIEHLAWGEICTSTTNGTTSHDRSISKEQEKQLRRRAGATQSESEKWNEVYRILFPDDDPEDMPTPCQ
jgi:hypothetical protein